MCTRIAEQVTHVGGIAAQVQLTTAGATRMLDTLETLGYATRYHSPNVDQRQVYVALTLVGRAALEQADRAFNARVAASLAPLTDAERQTLAALLGRLTTATADAPRRWSMSPRRRQPSRPCIFDEISLARGKGKPVIPFWASGDDWRSPLRLAHERR